jgi:pimeloyl-ACP methyl ester carboxylesterase
MKSTFFGLLVSSMPCFAAFAGDPPQQQPMAQRAFFYVGGRYASTNAGEVMTGQMYVEVLRPARVTRRYPLVLLHGAGQTGTNWIGTPDGRAGWADYFLAQGYVVYLVDQPARGRSAWHSSTNSPLSVMPPAIVAQRFTASEVDVPPPEGGGFGNGLKALFRPRPAE